MTTKLEKAVTLEKSDSTEREDVESAVEDVDATVADEAAEAPKGARRLPRLPRLRPRTWFDGVEIGPQTVKTVVAAALAAVALAATVYFLQFRPEQQTDDAGKAEVLRAATEGTIAMLSYAPENLDQAVAAAESHLTGDFLSYYTDFTQRVVVPAAREREVSTTASVVSAAVTEMHPDSAVVLLFVNQQTMSSDREQPSLAASTVVVNLTKVDDAWLISEFTPV